MKTSVSSAGTVRKNARFPASRLFYSDLVKAKATGEYLERMFAPLCLQRGAFVLGANDFPSLTPAAFG